MAPSRMVVEGHIATIHVTLVDVERRKRPRRADPEAATPPPPSAQFPEIFEPGESTPEWDPEAFKAALAAELTEDARRLLPTDDVTVEVTWKRGSLEIAAILVVGRTVADIGSFLGGVKAIRDLFPQRIRDRVSGWLGRNVAAASGWFETGTGLLDGQAETDEQQGGAGAGPAGVNELIWYAVLSLVVLTFVVVGVIGGLELLGVE